jgi:MYXO-CTERM domain-containing protein
MQRACIAVLVALAVASGARSACAAHVFDMNQHMPPHLAVMFTMAWFGIDKNDPQGPGPENGYGNWKQNFPACGLSNDPSTCADFQSAGLQRSIASKRRPMAGIYSATGRDAESLRRIDFLLSMLRRPCSSGARLDAWAVQLDSIKFTSRYPNNQQGNTWDIAYRALLAYLGEADKANLQNAVMVAIDSTIYWHFGSTYGLTTQAQRLAALEDDVVDMVNIAMAHPSALKLNGKPLLGFYVDSALLTVSEWQSVLDGARSRTGQDFYALGTTLNATYFGAFDALAPWVNIGMWNDQSSISDEHDRAVQWAKTEHAQILAALASNPGRVFFGGVTPGFDDYTQDWGACKTREIPRDPAVLTGEFDYLASVKQQVDLRGVFFETWDDWTEGTEFEPDVVEGSAKLLQLRQEIGALFGEPADPAGDQALTNAWKNFGQARNCCFAGGACPPTGPPVDLSCPAPDAGIDGGTAGAGGAGEAGASGGSGGRAGASASGGSAGSVTADASPDAAPAAHSGSSSGCGCRAAGSPSGGNPFALLSLACAAWLFRRRRRR